MQDIFTDNGERVQLMAGDITFEYGEKCKLLALRNYLRSNKRLILNLSSEAIHALILNKAIQLKLDINNIKYHLIKKPSSDTVEIDLFVKFNHR